MTKEFGCCPQTIEENEIETAILTMLKKMAAVVADREILEMRSATLTAEDPPLWRRSRSGFITVLYWG